MLGFSPLSTNPLSAIDDILRLESSALLDSISIIDPSAFIKFFGNSSYLIAGYLYGLYSYVTFSNSDINFGAEVFHG